MCREAKTDMTDMTDGGDKAPTIFHPKTLERKPDKSR